MLIYYTLKSNFKNVFFCTKNVMSQIRLLSTLNEISGILQTVSDAGWNTPRKQRSNIQDAKKFNAVKD